MGPEVQKAIYVEADLYIVRDLQCCSWNIEHPGKLLNVKVLESLSKLVIYVFFSCMETCRASWKGT